MTALSEAFAAALQHHRAGEARQAEQECRRILECEPQHAQALHLLGVLAQQAGRLDEALELLRQAVVLCPGEADFHYNLGVAQQFLGQKAEAQSSYQKALRLNPDHPAALNNLGNLALNSNQLEEAEDCLRHALRVQPDYGAAYHNLALVCNQRRKLEEAVSCLRQAVRLIPGDAAIHFQLGQVLEKQGKTDEAINAYREAVRLRPDHVMGQVSLGNLLTLGRHPGEALPHYQQAVRRQPQDPAHHSNLGNVLTQLGRPQEAEKCCREAVRLQPSFANGNHNLGVALAAQGRIEEALQSVEAALRIDPEHAGARHCRALWWLMQGRFAEGWPEYEWRWKQPDAVVRECREPVWDGSPLDGRTILLWTEQGLGDALQAIRFAPLVKERGGTVLVECPSALMPLLSRCEGIDRVVARGSLAPPADVQAPLMSLPRLLGITLETLPKEVPYLFADPDLVEQWRRELEGPPSLKIGIAWQGNPLYSGDCLRSIPLKYFAALARLPGVRLLSLQKGIGSEQRQAALDLFYVADLGCRLDETTGAFMDTAAVMQNLDLIVTSDTSIAHLAGGLGVPVWVALGIGADWRFLMHREDNPWYPTMRLFRQTRLGDWDEVFARIVKELSQRTKDGPSPADLAQLFKRALEHFEAGERQTAEQICRQLLEAEPCHAEASNTFGVMLHLSGRTEEARPYLERATALRPQDAGFHYNLGVARQVLGQTEQAVASYRQTLRFQPDHASALNNLGYALSVLGQLAEAQERLEQAVRLQPHYAEAHSNLGAVYLRRGELEKAVATLEQVVRSRPDTTDSSKDAADIPAEHRALLQLDYSHVYHNLALALNGLGRYHEALFCIEQSLNINPDHFEPRFVRSLIWLTLGDFERGWRDYENRWHYRSISKPAGPQPLWDGSPLKGQTILLWAEQGYGDTIHFIRYAPLVKQQGCKVVLRCPAKLTRLLSSCPGIDHLQPHNGPLPDYDVHAPLLSLPRILGTTLETIPANVPYLFADNDLVEQWRSELSDLHGFRVGIAWQGDPTYRCDNERSIPLRHHAALGRVPGVRLISLQKGPGVEQLREVSGLFSVIDLGPRLDETSGAFMDTAAIMKGLDLVITSDTAVAHLAGAMGVPVWVAVAFAPEWRWLLDREDSPWYPSMRLFRQSGRGDWEEVFARMAGELRRKIGAAAPLEVRIPVAPGELIDKITILEIKTERIQDTVKLANVRTELAELTAARERCLPNSAELARLTGALKAVNEALWQVEDDLRECERARDFGPRFIQLARSVYQHNDRRAALKRQINELLGSRLIEEKSYAAY
jgi:tetratricopeptide (TPR) repeat protein